MMSLQRQEMTHNMMMDVLCGTGMQIAVCEVSVTGAVSTHSSFSTYEEVISD